MKSLTLHARLTLWYFVSLALIVTLFAGASWFAMRASMVHSIDRDLRFRIEEVAPYIQKHGLNSRAQFEQAFAESPDAAIVGVFVQIVDAQGTMVYESDVLRAHRVAKLPEPEGDGSPMARTAGDERWPVRIASQHIVVNGVVLTVHVVEPLRDMLNSLREFRVVFLLLTVAALALTTTAGYWMSRRALAPVEQIRKQAEAIDPADLTARLMEPPVDDELARLARTLNAMLARIEAAFHSMQRFTADASHELRAPLALILTAGEVSLRRERTREELAGVIGKIVGEARHMSRLVENLLELARSDARQLHVELTPVDLGPLLRGLCDEMMAPAAAKGIALTAELPEETLAVMGDVTELRQLFVILLDNAIKYTESGGIQVNAHRMGKEIEIAVMDTGIGIEGDALPHVFERFWRVDKVRSRAEGGAGLGLSLAEQIVERHGGSIGAESEPGTGSTFTVRLRAAEVDS